MSLSKFGFKCGGKRTKTGDNETKNKKAKSKNAKMNTRSIATIVSTAMAWGNAFQSVRHTVSTDNNGAERKNVCEVCPFFFWATGFGIRATRILKLVFRRDTKI